MGCYRFHLNISENYGDEHIHGVVIYQNEMQVTEN